MTSVAFTLCFFVCLLAFLCFVPVTVLCKHVRVQLICTQRRYQKIYTQASLCIPGCSGTGYAEGLGLRASTDLSESGTNSGQSNCSWTTVHQTNQVSLERPRLKPDPTCGGSGLHAMRGSVPSPPSAQFETARGARTCEATTGRKLSLS